MGGGASRVGAAEHRYRDADVRALDGKLEQLRELLKADLACVAGRCHDGPVHSLLARGGDGEAGPHPCKQHHRSMSFQEVCAFLRANEVGRTAFFMTPYGRRLMCYCDLTATGRLLHFVEAWICRINAFYANTHTAVSSLGRLMTNLRESSRAVIAEALNCAKGDTVIFCGSGATAAVNTLVGLLSLRIDRGLIEQFDLMRLIPEEKRPIVLVGPYEHHSNQLPWRESVARIVEVGLAANGTLDFEDLERKASDPRYADAPLKIGSFSAASNVTGVITDVRRVSRILHRHGFYAVFDYAGGAPYMPIDMHPGSEDERIDALFLSVHKFIGGPQSSGVLAVNSALVRNKVPARPGGGTVQFVFSNGTGEANPFRVEYIDDVREREEGGTPAIISDIRAGAAFIVKQVAQPEHILQHEIEMSRCAIERLSKLRNVRILGPRADVPRLGMISFVVEGLHQSFVSCLLDHLFGIQNRAGCSCAGPYGVRLLQIKNAEEYAHIFLKYGAYGIKPGWVRLSLPYYFSSTDIEYVLSCVEFVAQHGRNFLPFYDFSWATGAWTNRSVPNPDVPPIELSATALLESAHSFAAGSYEEPMCDATINKTRATYIERASREATRGEMLMRDAVLRPPTGIAELDRLVYFDYVHHTDLPSADAQRKGAPSGWM